MRYWAHHESGCVFTTPDELAKNDGCDEVSKVMYYTLLLIDGYEGPPKITYWAQGVRSGVFETWPIDKAEYERLRQEREHPILIQEGYDV